MTEVKKVKQLVVEAPDKPGLLADVCAVMAKAGVNLEATCAYGMDGKAIFYLICSDNKKAKVALAKKGLKVKETEVVVVGLENRAGALSEIADKLKAKKINLLYCYGSTCDCLCDYCRFVFKAGDNDKAIAALR
jgi:hypothetical protein